ncbi:Long-chain-fatty-acid--CoA ligase FadD15 [compost metagenome]
MIDRENVEKFAQEAQLAYTDFASLVAVPQIRMLIGKVVEAANSKFARVESIKDFRILPVELTPEDEEVTPTMKLKRRVIERKWESLIESMYGGASL